MEEVFFKIFSLVFFVFPSPRVVFWLVGERIFGGTFFFSFIFFVNLIYNFGFFPNLKKFFIC